MKTITIQVPERLTQTLHFQPPYQLTTVVPANERQIESLVKVLLMDGILNVDLIAPDPGRKDDEGALWVRRTFADHHDFVRIGPRGGTDRGSVRKG
jgi:hypothetical protein